MATLDLSRYIGTIRGKPGQNWHALAFQAIQDWARSIASATAPAPATSSIAIGGTVAVPAPVVPVIPSFPGIGVLYVTPSNPLMLDPSAAIMGLPVGSASILRIDPLTEDITSVILSPGSYDGQPVVLSILQDSSGGHLFNMPLNIRNSLNYDIGPQFPNGQPNAQTILTLSYNAKDSLYDVAGVNGPS